MVRIDYTKGRLEQEIYANGRGDEDLCTFCRDCSETGLRYLSYCFDKNQLKYVTV